MVRLSYESRFRMFYHLCSLEALKKGVSLYDFLADELEDSEYFSLSNIAYFLKRRDKLDPLLEETLSKDIVPLGMRKLDAFKEIIKLPKEEVCFVVNYFLADELQFVYGSTDRLVVLRQEINHETLLVETASNYPEIFEIKQISYDKQEVIERNDNDLYEKVRLSKTYITLRNEPIKEEIAEQIYLLEEIIKDDLASHPINRLKELLSSELGIEF